MKRTPARYLLAWLVLTASLGACSAITGFRGLVGDAPATDAATDAATADGAQPTDGGAASDASTSVDAMPPAPAFCADSAAFVLCDDFDNASTRLLDTWDQVFIGNAAGAVVVDTNASVSPRGSLLSTCAGGGSDNGSLVKKTFTGHTRAVLSADVRLDAFDKVGYGAVLEIHLAPVPGGFSDYRVALIYTAGKMTLDVFSQNDEAGTTQAAKELSLDFSQWQRISIELAMNPTPHATAYDTTGIAIGTLPMPAFASSSTSTGQYVVAGATYLQGNAMPWKVRHDNITVLVGD